MYCNLCGKHLYEHMSFQILFKWSYNIHPECEQKRRVSNDFITVPVDHGLVHYDYLFAEGHQDADKYFLFEQYMGDWLIKALNFDKWSTIVLLDEIQDMSDLQLILPLGGESVILFSLFDSVLVRDDENEKS